MEDRDYMQMAIDIAAVGEGRVTPNPLVGAVIVKDGRVIGKGAHESYGQLHAERNALARCTEDPKGATIYVTLEPCCHHGKQPPCTDALIEAGIARVVVGSLDPNPLVAGKGIKILEEAGIRVETGFMKEECDRLARVFLHFMTTGRPLVILKYAMTMDGKIAAYTGKSQWITGEEARAHVHRLRNRYAAIMVGVGTVYADDPMLTARYEGAVSPVRIICDSWLKTPLTAKVVTTAREVPTILATCEDDVSRHQEYLDAGCEILVTESRDGHVDLNDLMSRLAERRIDSVLLEGGANLAWSAVRSGIVDLVDAYIAPKLMGGAQAKSPVGGQGFPDPVEALQLADSRILRFGEDILIESEVVGCSQGS